MSAVDVLKISIHAPHARSDLQDPEFRAQFTISIHAPHARSDSAEEKHHEHGQISIHAPHARSDATAARAQTDKRYFNPRSSCEERLLTASRISATVGFQSTLLMRGATRYLCWYIVRDNISIHAPHARSDDDAIDDGYRPCKFQSTLLMRGATLDNLALAVRDRISIHAPHARSDMMIIFKYQRVRDFNPRSSCEERRDGSLKLDFKQKFQSTLLMRGATIDWLFLYKGEIFQSTLLMRGATTLATKLHRVYSHFNPRSSCEERHHNSRFVITVWRFQSTLLMRGATGTVCLYDKARDISIHAPHARSDPRCCR